jgi:hypothetical protein
MLSKTARHKLLDRDCKQKRRNFYLHGFFAHSKKNFIIGAGVYSVSVSHTPFA